MTKLRGSIGVSGTQPMISVMLSLQMNAIYIDNSKAKGWLPVGFNPIETQQFSPRLSVWATIGRFGSVNIFVYEGITDSEAYINLLEDHLLPAVGQDTAGLGWGGS